MHGLGELEAAVMDVLWRVTEPMSVREVLERLDTGRPLAYTTVMSVLDNLHKKAWVQRELRGKAYWYRPALTKGEAAARALREVLDSSGDPHAVLLHFARSASTEESEVLRKGLRRRKSR